MPVYHEKHPHPTPAGIIPDPFELADEIHNSHHFTTPAPHLHSTTLGPDLPLIDPKPHRNSLTAVPHLPHHQPTPIPGQPKQYLDQDELRHKFHSAKPHGSDHPVRSLPIKKKYVHHPTQRPHHHQPGFPLYGSPTTLAPVLLHPDPRTKTGRPKQAKTYPKHNFSTLKPHRPTTVQPKHLVKSQHPYGPSPKPKSLPRLAPTHSPHYDPYVQHHPSPTPFPYHIESATAAGFAVFPSAAPQPHREVHLAEDSAAFQLDPQQPAEFVDDGPRRIVLPTILRSGDLFEGGEGGLIQPTIGPFDDEIGPPPPNVASGFIAPEFLPTTNRFDDGNNNNSSREKKEANISKRSSEEEEEDGKDKKKVHKIEITKIRFKS